MKSILLLTAFASATISSAADPFLTGDFRWRAGDPVLSPAERTNDRCFSVKDPTIVFSGGRWHLFSTIRSVRSTHQIEYCSFTDWPMAAASERHILDGSLAHATNRGMEGSAAGRIGRPATNGYFCAPQVFWFEPHHKWYMIYQANDKSRKVALQPVFSTSTNIAAPHSWTGPSFLYPAHPDNVESWIDFWVICDDTRAHLFFTSNNGKFWRAETKLAEFPYGWTRPEVVLRGDIFEASHTYGLKGREQFLTIIEAIGERGRRYYKAYTADRLDGKWEPLAASAEKPFASPRNVQFTGTPWSDSFSHGEMLRTGADQRMEIDPENLVLLYQGVRDGRRAGKPYGEIPWELGLLRLSP
ncbi:MAG: hypothetical protein QOF48_2761 [Verrucomicrobiota bacterium]|jgi:hypothetical protein